MRKVLTGLRGVTLRSYLYRVFFVVLFLDFILIKNCYAYIDPGTGSYILQVIAGVFLGGLFFIKITWTKIARFFKKNINLKKRKNNG